MKLLVYAIYDKAVEAYTRPFFVQAPGQAVRLFNDEVNTVDSPMNKHAEDYSCFRLGEFDDATGEFNTGEPVCVARGHEVLAKEQ